MDALNMFNKVGSHMSANLQVYNVVCGYIKRDISLHDMIIGIICVFGYRDNIQLQNLLSVITRYAGNPQSLDLHLILKRDLPDLRRHYSNNPLFGFYSDLYDLVVSYKFF
jgi:hypothetical protein